MDAGEGGSNPMFVKKIKIKNCHHGGQGMNQLSEGSYFLCTFFCVICKIELGKVLIWGRKKALF